MTERKTLTEIIDGWEKEAAAHEGELQGSAFSLMKHQAEHQNIIAKRMREMIAELKEAAVPVSPTALIGYDELDNGTWFVFPEAISRLVRPGAVCTEWDRCMGPLHVKMGPNYYGRLEDKGDTDSITILENDDEKKMKVVEIKRPTYIKIA